MGWFALLVFFYPRLGTAEATKDAAPFIDSKTIKDRFSEVTAADMDMLRTKKILFASRSFGLNLAKGINALAKEDKKYALLDSYQRFDLVKAGGDFNIIPPDVFEKTKFVHFLATYWPHTKRVEEMDHLLREPPHSFGKVVDAVIIFYHTALPEAFDKYSATMDALRRDFPKVRFIYVTAGFMADSRAKENESAHAFSEKVRAKYKGIVPVYDLGAILSDDFRCGHAFCPEYSDDPAGVHPNNPKGEAMMAKGFLLVLRDAFRQDVKLGIAATKEAAPATAQPSVNQNTNSAAATLLPTHPDVKAVRAILDANGLTKKTVESVSKVRDGRIVALYLQEGGMVELPDAIGTLTGLEVLHVYGDRSLPHPLLKKISPAIGNCAKLDDLLLNSNELTTLPVEITRLQKLTSLSLADNHLHNLPAPVAAWAARFDPKGLSQQRR